MDLRLTERLFFVDSSMVQIRLKQLQIRGAVSSPRSNATPYAKSVGTSGLQESNSEVKFINGDET